MRRAGQGTSRGDEGAKARVAADWEGAAAVVCCGCGAARVARAASRWFRDDALNAELDWPRYPPLPSGTGVAGTPISTTALIEPTVATTAASPTSTSFRRGVKWFRSHESPIEERLGGLFIPSRSGTFAARIAH